MSYSHSSSQAAVTNDTNDTNAYIYNKCVQHYNGYTQHSEHKEYREKMCKYLLKNESLGKNPIVEYGAVDKKSDPQYDSFFDVGCGNGDLLYIVKNVHNVQNVSGIDISADMCQNVRDKYGIHVSCQSFDDYSSKKKYDIVSAQAFVHLYKKTEVSRVIEKLLSITGKKLYITTTQELESAEGMFAKEGTSVARYRAKYTRDEFIKLIHECVQSQSDEQLSYEIFEFDVDKRKWSIAIIYRHNLQELYKRDGFIVFKNLVSQDDIKKLQNYADEQKTKPSSDEVLRYKERDYDTGNNLILDRIENIFKNPPPHISQIIDPLKDMLDKVCGHKFKMLKDKINWKSPGKGKFPPHQDALAGWANKFGPIHLNLCISIDASTRENGALEFVRGQHDKGLFAGIGKTLSAEFASTLNWELTPTNSGDVIIFDSYVPHRSDVNSSNTSRRMAFITYIPEENWNDEAEKFYMSKRAKQPTLDDNVDESKLYRDDYGKYMLKKDDE